MTGPGLSTSRTAGSTGHINDTNTVHSYINQLGGMFVPVEIYGAVGNGSTDDYAAFAAATTAAGSNGWVLLQSGKTYALASQWVLPSNTKIWAYGATIKAISAGSSDRVVYCSDVSNIRIHGLTIDGNKAAFGGTTEQRHGFHLIGCSNVRLIDVNASSCKGDGLYIGRGASTGCTDVIVERSVFNANHRNAMSLIDVTGAKFVNCEFINTSGTTPQDGVDIEPNISGNTVTDVVFTRCKMSGNTGDGLAFNRLNGGITPTVARIKVENCEIKNNILRGVIISYVSAEARLDFIDTEVEGNSRYGYSIEPTASTGDIKIRGGSVRTSQWAGIVLSPAASMTLSRVLIEGVSVIDNSVAGASSYDGIWVQRRCHRVSILGNCIANVAAANQGVPIWSDVSGGTATDITYLRMIGNTYNTVSGVFLNDDATTRTNTGNN